MSNLNALKNRVIVFCFFFVVFLVCFFLFVCFSEKNPGSEAKI